MANPRCSLVAYGCILGHKRRPTPSSHLRGDRCHRLAGPERTRTQADRRAAILKLEAPFATIRRRLVRTRLTVRGVGGLFQGSKPTTLSMMRGGCWLKALATTGCTSRLPAMNLWTKRPVSARRTRKRSCRSLVLASHGAFRGEPTPLFVKASAYGSLDAETKATITGELDELTLVQIQAALRPLRQVSIDQPLAFLDDGAALKPEDSQRLPAILQEFYDRHGRLAVLSLALAYELGLAQGKIHVAPHLIDGLNQAFAVIGDFPTTEASEAAAGRFRAAAPMLFMTPLEDGADCAKMTAG